ncbi:acetoin dehydrogenase dihydrolipoyllysine-residue acetyltransferase subunit [Brucella sp. ZJ1_1]|jgi:pyruvate dehydrogenase E2 component (dihydrolipoamide acetyltransferase)|uniref:Dihydrolipoyllysine-residue succinyltransferase component of 2-oxoglutarate dehydrogenase complex n=2 Tax=Brucella intermedia TaxID=94625 RepID=C4WR57_9HYPH|nr:MULTISPECIES: acetoin dehydrogenase dihydrolipoyllysine-residue acetyltransferase subunit [Brucella]EEQ92808.1 Dihydrolipoyllysine-residue succinyltransferase component of 2- oxoglutarate dehydrogenase complex [Brucella intermedia LMG 3301]ELT48617.1 acetoin dehydrogenase E2 subunit dihydrolipoyllysine-residue acetyltransferase [Brucella intermedia M86]MCH6205750.1 acetoin dehydrogenase dihydrolipoyllysine-residue acetyltransferase subunit [Brucella ciceri]OOC49113.1 acetoin dehydrogenase [B
MAVEVILPKVDMDMETGQISRWYAKDGDMVTKGQLLFEIETDKAAMEVEAPASGVIADISAAEGAVVPVGQAVAWIYEEGEERSGKPAAVAQEPIAAAPVDRAIETATPKQHDPKSSQDDERDSADKVRATPLARRLARDAGIDLATVQGSGPKGRVQKKDVEGDIGVANLAIPAKSFASKNAEPTPLGQLNAIWLREGEAGRLPVVLLHGFAADLNSWRGLFAGASLGRPILALDLPGHGNSPRIVPENIDDIAAGVEATLGSLGVSSCLLVGHSLGGAVASVVAARGLIDVRSLLLISSGGLGPQINGAFIKGLVGAKSEASIVPWLKLLVADETRLTKPFINATVTQAADTELRNTQEAIGARFFADGTQTFEIRSSIAALAMPVRLIFGAEDRVIPVVHAHGLPGKVGVHIFAGCGHMPQIEERTAVLQILKECAAAAEAM